MAGMEDEKERPAAEVAPEPEMPEADEADSAAPETAREDSFIAGVLGENPMAREGNPYASYLSRSVFLEEGSPPKLVQGTTTSLTILLAGFLLFAGIIQLDERAVAPGEILPENFVQPVQHLEGGIVANFLVKEGALVKAGQPLIVLDETAPRAEYESLRARLAGLRAVEERLRAFVLNRQADFSGPAENYPELVRDQTQILATQISSKRAQTLVIRAQITELTEQALGLERQEVALVTEVDLNQQEVDLRGKLLGQGLTSKVVYIATQRNLARAQRELAEVQTERARTKAKIAEARQRILELEERLGNEALTNMGTVAGERAEVEAALARLEDRVRRATILAPRDGRVKGLINRAIGGVIQPGEVVLEIVPVTGKLIAEVHIAPRDVGHVAEGQRVLVKIDTYNYARHGGVKGTLVQLSASSFHDSDGEPYFRGRIKLDQPYVGADPGTNRITPGMTLRADIKTGQKSLLGYLLRPIRNTLTDAFGER